MGVDIIIEPINCRTRQIMWVPAFRKQNTENFAKKELLKEKK